MNSNKTNTLLHPFLISLAVGFFAGVVIGVNVYLK